jgi:light-regulated signal transduction histidine kinase (bacteriophytochrome)
LDEKADKYIHYASDGARRMQRLVADLLEYSRVGSQGKSLLPVDANAVLVSVLDSLQALIGGANATVEHGALPLVLADEVQLRQVFQNLISNAIKFRSAAAPHVTVKATAASGRWLFSVADNGIGLDMKHAARIFQMFQRLHELGRYEGSGIGLAIAKRIVERHGGSIWVESQIGAGTTFCFSLKCVPKSES